VTTPKFEQLLTLFSDVIASQGYNFIGNNRKIILALPADLSVPQPVKMFALLKRGFPFLFGLPPHSPPPPLFDITFQLGPIVLLVSVEDYRVNGKAEPICEVIISDMTH
jgi:hypothetical protein